MTSIAARTEPDERMATLSGAGLPGHVDPRDWDLMILSVRSPELALLEDVAEDIADHGFSYFKLVDPPDAA